MKNRIKNRIKQIGAFCGDVGVVCGQCYGGVLWGRPLTLSLSNGSTSSFHGFRPQIAIFLRAGFSCYDGTFTFSLCETGGVGRKQAKQIRKAEKTKKAMTPLLHTIIYIWGITFQPISLGI